MHLGNGAITPECGVVALGAAASGACVAYLAARAQGVDRAQARQAGVLGAAVFAAQMFNVPVAPFSSVHLIGGVLLAWMLGPALGLLTMTGILSVQAVLLGDGGLLALGANIVNMGLLPALAVAAVRRMSTARGAAANALRLGMAAFAATVLAAGLIVVEVGLGRGADHWTGLGSFASRLLAYYALAGAIEAAASVVLVYLLGGIELPAPAPARLSAGRAGWIVGGSLALAVLSWPEFGLASAAPDAYEAALQAASRWHAALGRLEAVDQLSGWGAAAQAVQHSVGVSLAGWGPWAGVLATAMAGGLAWGCAVVCGRARLGVAG